MFLGSEKRERGREIDRKKEERHAGQKFRKVTSPGGKKGRKKPAKEIKLLDCLEETGRINSSYLLLRIYERGSAMLCYRGINEAGGATLSYMLMQKVINCEYS